MKLVSVPLLICVCFFCAPFVRAQQDDAADLNKMLKEAQELQKQAAEIQKQNPPSPDAKKKLAGIEAEAKIEVARQEKEEQLQKQKLQAALEQQLEAPGKVSLPHWMPATSQFKTAGPTAKKIVDDEVQIVQTGTSTIGPKELADAWEAAATTAGDLNHVRNDITVNGRITMIMFLSTRTDPEEKVKMEATRSPGERLSQVEISSPLPKPIIDDD